MKSARSSPALRVPQITAIFWVLKLLTTGIGETTSDFLVTTFEPVTVVLIAAVAFIGCFALQFSARRYVPWRYWLFVTMVAIFGTMAADITHIVLDVPYLVSSAAFAVVLIALLVVWRRVEGTISVHSVSTARREVLYWAVVLATFALGTALGDLVATVFGLGYLGSGILFAVVFAIPLILNVRGVADTTTFWAAYIVTRPLGASFADWFAVNRSRGGLDLGTPAVSGVGIVTIVIIVTVLQIRRRAD